MSVLIRGMEMPKNCSGCPLNYDQMACKVTGTRWWSDTMVLMGFDSDKERLYDCPLVEIPPHGRLGDLDALQKQVENTIQDAHMSLLWKQGMMYAHGLVEASKTVIEAEGSET